MAHPDESPTDSVFEIITTTRAMRRLKPDPVPDDLVRKVLDAAVCAPSASNSQRWRFLVVKDPEIKRGVQHWYQRAFTELVEPHYLNDEPPPGVSPARFRRQYEAVKHLTEHFHEAPVWIVPCVDEGDAPPSRMAGASVYPAVQNLLLAARALGLGATLTTRHLVYEQESEAALGLPAGVHSYAIVPLGYPSGNFGPVRRRLIDEVAYLDRWGEDFPA
jgi:nitroreductase